MGKQFWLMKTEPDVYSIDDLKRDGRTYWDGVRNYQARNFMRDQMTVGDPVFFYHSNAEPSGIAGIAEVASKSYPDPSAKSLKDKATWYVVDLQFVEKFSSVIPLEELRKVQALQKMPLLKRGQRLSVQPVNATEWQVIVDLAKRRRKP